MCDVTNQKVTEYQIFKPAVDGITKFVTTVTLPSPFKNNFDSLGMQAAK